MVTTLCIGIAKNRIYRTGQSDYHAVCRRKSNKWYRFTAGLSPRSPLQNINHQSTRTKSNATSHVLSVHKLYNVYTYTNYKIYRKGRYRATETKVKPMEVKPV
jgi:hypothetical protein